MITAASAASPLSLPSAVTVPVRSPRTSMILAELTRQRRYERRERRLKRQQRRRAWARVRTWLAALGQEPFAGTAPLVYALQPSW